MSANERIFDYKLKGYCCSQIITAMILEDLGKENTDLIGAMGAFCDGLGVGEICGTLAASIGMLYMVDPKEAEKGLKNEFMDWFYDAYGGYNCKEIVNDDPSKKMEICPVMIENCYNMLYEMLEDKIDA